MPDTDPTPEEAPSEETPEDPNRAAPGPHPHQAADIVTQAGEAGKAAARGGDPMEGYREEPEATHAEDDGEEQTGAPVGNGA